jgi:hypothetical protein
MCNILALSNSNWALRGRSGGDFTANFSCLPTMGKLFSRNRNRLERKTEKASLDFCD